MEDNYVTQTGNSSKSALLLLSIIGVLVISTLVVISSYFLRPTIEFDLKEKLVSSLSKVGLNTPLVRVSGRDVELHGSVATVNELTIAEETAKRVWGVRQVNNHLLIKNTIDK